MAREHQSRLSHVEDIHDERRKKQLRLEDDLEDFLDESKGFSVALQTKLK